MLRLHLRGRGIAPQLVVEPRHLHFGVLHTYEWADQLLTLSSLCNELPMRIAAHRSAAYFSIQPAELELSPGGSVTVLLRYQPKVGFNTVWLNIYARPSICISMPCHRNSHGQLGMCSCMWLYAGLHKHRGCYFIDRCNP